MIVKDYGESNSPYYRDHCYRVTSVKNLPKKGWIIWNWLTHKWDDISDEERDVIKQAEAEFYS